MNETEEEEERCLKHKLPLTFICQTCNNLQCCYKCFTVSNTHFEHQNIFIAENDISNYGSNIIEEQYVNITQNGQYQQKKVNDNQQQIDNNEFNEMKNYRIQIDELCKQITEQVWNYRQKFIQYMDQKLNEYNEFIIVEQGFQITTEIIQMRNELENFIINLKYQIHNIDYQNEQKSRNLRQLECYCQQKSFNYQNIQLQAENSNSDGDLLSFQHTTPSFNSCSLSNSSPQKSSSSNLSPSQYSCSSSSTYLNSVQVYQQDNQKQNQHEQPYQIHNQTHNDNPQHIYPNSKSLSHISNKTTKQHLFNCPQHNKQINQEGKMFTMNEDENSPNIQTSFPKQQSPYQSSQIFIILTNGKSLPLLYNIYSSVLQVKILIFEKTGVPPLEQKLFYQTKELHNYTIMKDYNIPRDCSIKLYIRSFYQQLQSICKKAICSKILPNSNFQFLSSTQSQNFQANTFEKYSNFNVSYMINENNQSDESQSSPYIMNSEYEREPYLNQQQSDNTSMSKQNQNQNYKNNERRIMLEETDLYDQNSIPINAFICTRRQF